MNIFQNIIQKIDVCGGDNVSLPGGARFINKLNRVQSLRYSHKIFQPIETSEIDTIDSYLGFAPDLEYIDLLSKANGAILFDHILYIFGFCKEISRSIALDDQRAISIQAMQREFSTSCRNHYQDGWRAVGSLVLYDKIWIVVGPDGKAGFIAKRGAFFHYRFGILLESVINFLSARVGCCCQEDVDGKEIEREFLNILDGSGQSDENFTRR